MQAKAIMRPIFGLLKMLEITMFTAYGNSVPRIVRVGLYTHADLESADAHCPFSKHLFF